MEGMRKRGPGLSQKYTTESKKSRASSCSSNDNTSSQISCLESYSQKILQAALEERRKRQLKYRQAIQQLRKQLPTTSENEDDALKVFPEEMWVKIFKNINNTDTLIKCSIASSVFRRIAKPEECMFGKTLPFLSVYLSKNDILACRQVCSKWRSGVESFIESYHNIPPPLNTAIFKPSPDQRIRKYNFKTFLRFTPAFERQYIVNRELIILPSGSVTVVDFFESDAERVQQFDEWMNTHGGGVRHVTFDMKKEYTKLEHLFLLCERLVKYCPNVKSLTLAGGFLDGAKPKSVPQVSFTMPNLASLTVSTKCPILQNVQHRLIQSLSGQLKQVTVCHWKSVEYEKLPWNNLLKLDIIEGNTSQTLKSLATLTAPNLQKLRIRLDSSTHDLALLFKTLNHFPNLTSLGLTLTEQCPNWSSNEITNIPVTLLTINKITTLEVITENNMACRDFLILFPLLRNLISRHGKNSARGSVFQDKTVEQDSDEYQDFSKDESSEYEGTGACHTGSYRYEQRYGGCCGPEVGSRPVVKSAAKKLVPSSEFLDLNKFCEKRHLKSFYKSNIWKVMPLLENLQLQCVYCQPKGYQRRHRPKRFTKFFNMTRQAYIWEKVEWEQKQQRHVEKVWEEAKQQMKNKIKILSSGGGSSGKKRSKATSRQTRKDLQDQALSLVFKKLGKRDLISIRLVSKFWKSIADKHFLYDELRSRDNVYRVTLTGDHRYIGVRHYDIKGNFVETKRKKHESDSCSDSEVEYVIPRLNKNPTAAQLKGAKDKPFFGCITEVTFKDDLVVLTEKIYNLLDTIGTKIEHLHVSSSKNVNVDNVHKICVKILKSCPNLRSVDFHFIDLCCDTSTWSLKPRASKTFMCHKNLESITLVGPGPGEWGMPPNVTKLMKPCENWLSSFVNFANLKELKMSAESSDVWMNSVEKYLRVPNLENLELQLGGDGNTIKQLVNIVNKFPKLKFVELGFYAGFGGLGNLGVIYTNPSCLSTNVTDVKLTMPKQEEVSLDFMVHFPFLKKLSITYGAGATRKVKREGNCDISDDEEDSEKEENGDGLCVREPQRDYLQLVKYFGKNKPIRHNTEKILQSNIWTALKRLENMEVVCCLMESHKQKTIFTREQREAKVGKEITAMPMEVQSN